MLYPKTLIAGFRQTGLAVIAGSILASQALYAGTIVSIESALGSFKIELYDEQLPITVANFLNYIESGKYHFTMVDYADSFVISGGGFLYNSCSEGPVAIAANPAISVESTQFPNDAGTIAMVRDSASNTVQNRWIINLSNNSSLGNPATNPVVFGEVIESSNVVSIIANQWRVPMNISPAVPTIGYDGNLQVSCGFFNQDNVVALSYSIDGVGEPEPEPDAPAVSFNETSGLLVVKVDIGEPVYYQISFSIAATEPEVVIQGLPNTVLTLPGIVDKIATFDGVSGELYIPELVVGDTVAFRDVRFVLTDLTNLLFTLQSFAQ